MRKSSKTITNRTPRTFTKEKVMVDSSGRYNPTQPSVDWFVKPREELHEHVFARVRQIKSAQVTRRYELFTYQQAYTSRFGPAIQGSLFSPTTRNPSIGLFGISANVIKSCIDTACSQIAKEKPRAFVLPNKMDARLKQKAKKLTKFLDGVMVSSGAYAKSEDVFRSACIFGDGFLLIRHIDGEIRADSLKIDEVHIDMVDGMYDDPMEVHWVHPEPRRELIKKYPKFEKEINEARGAWRGELTYMGQADLVEVVYSWRRGVGGTRTVSVCTTVLEQQDWTKDYLPVIRFHWTEPTYGPFGDGIAKELFGMQRVITDILRGITKSIRMFAVPRIWVSKLANVAQQTVSNEISVNTYSGERPVFDTPPAAAPDIYQFVQWCIDWCYKQLGLSQLSAQSEKPAGLNAAVALRAYQDVGTQRFALVGQRWERFHMQVAEVTIDTAADAYAANDNALSVKVPGRGFIETIDWKDASLKKDQYDVAVWPTNLLPHTPEGRLQTAQEYINSGFMPRSVAISQLNIPILNDWIDQETAAQDDIERCLSLIVDKSRYVAPDAIGDVDLAVSMAQSAVLRAEADELEIGKQELLQKFLQRALQLQAIKNTPPPQAAPPPGAIGQAPPPPPAPLAQAGSGPVPMPTAA
jgi:hypothetical protein